MMTETDNQFMKRCEVLAAIAAERGASSVGSVLVLGGEIKRIYFLLPCEA